MAQCDCESDMLLFIVKRLLWMIPSLFAVSFLAFVLIQLPPGDYVTTYIATLAASNEVIDHNTAAQLRERFGLDDPMIVQYLKWIWGIISRGDFGISFEWQQPVSGLIWERMALTLVLAIASLLATGPSHFRSASSPPCANIQSAIIFLPPSPFSACPYRHSFWRWC
jgi:peptide/nickel transport system permease protein